MRFTLERKTLHVEIDAKDCDIPADERTRLRKLLAPVADAVRDLPRADLWLTVNFHPDRQEYHTEAKLKAPGTTLFAAAWDSYLDSSQQTCLARLVRRLQTYAAHPDRAATEDAERRLALERDIVAPEDPEGGPLAQACQAGDYRAFRAGLVAYEDWLRTRVGRWIQRYPEAEQRLGKDLSIGDLVEQVYLHAFEQFTHRPTAIRLSEWLDDLIDPALNDLLRDPEEEHAAASFARTVREGAV